MVLDTVVVLSVQALLAVLVLLFLRLFDQYATWRTFGRPSDPAQRVQDLRLTLPRNRAAALMLIIAHDFCLLVGGVMVVAMLGSGVRDAVVSSWALVTPTARTECPSIAEFDLLAIHAACQEYRTEHGSRWPSSIDVLVEPDAGGERYLDGGRMPLDPWGRPYAIAQTDSDSIRVFTLGADCLPGGEGEDEDHWFER